MLQVPTLFSSARELCRQSFPLSYLEQTHLGDAATAKSRIGSPGKGKKELFDRKPHFQPRVDQLFQHVDFPAAWAHGANDLALAWTEQIWQTKPLAPALLKAMPVPGVKTTRAICVTPLHSQSMPVPSPRQKPYPPKASIFLLCFILSCLFFLGGG